MEPTNNFLPQNNLSNNPPVPPVNPVSPGFIPKADPAPVVPPPQPAPAPEPVAPSVPPTGFVPPQQVQAPVETRSNAIVWILSAVIVLMALGGAWYWYQNQEPSIPAVVQDEVGVWKKYTNAKYGFEIEYPHDWEVDEELMIVSNGRTKVYFAPEGPGRESVFDSFGSKVTKLSDVMFAGKSARMYSCPDTVECPSQLAYSKIFSFDDLPAGWKQYNEVGFDIYVENKTDYEVANQILSTFKFTEPISTADWKTYVNEEFGFSLQMPDGYRLEWSTTTDYIIGEAGDTGTIKNVTILRFVIPTKDTSEGQYSFNIVIFPKNSGVKLSKPGEYIFSYYPDYLGENESFLFASDSDSRTVNVVLGTFKGI